MHNLYVTLLKFVWPLPPCVDYVGTYLNNFGTARKKSSEFFCRGDKGKFFFYVLVH